MYSIFLRIGVLYYYLMEDLVQKMVDFSNHRNFMLKCIKLGFTQVSCKLKNTIKDTRGNQIIKRQKDSS